MSNNDLLTIREILHLKPFDYAWVQIGEIGEFEIMQVQLTKIKTLCFKAFDGSSFNLGDKSIFGIEKIERKIMSRREEQKEFFKDKKKFKKIVLIAQKQNVIIVNSKEITVKNFFKKCDVCKTGLKNEIYTKNKGLCSDCINKIN